MGREKSAFYSRDKALHKTSVQCQVISRPTKKPNQNKKELEEMDSLMFLKGSKDKKEGNGLDEKFKLLKSELKMLLSDSKLENSHNQNVSSYDSVLVNQDLLVEKYDQKKPLVLKSVEKSSPKAEQPEKLLPTNFSEWRDKTVDEMTQKSQNQKEYTQRNDLLLNTKPQKASTSEKFSPAKYGSKLKFIDSNLLSQFKVEQLLYKSFYLQHFEIYLSGSDENDPEEIKSTKALKQQKRKIRKSFKSNKEKFYQSNLNRCYRSSHKVRKKRTVAKGPSKSSRDLAYNSASDSNNVVEEKNVDYVELDVSDYDWSEPFEIDEKTVFSDVEILESPGKKRTDTSKEIKHNNSGPVECDINTTSDELGKDNLRMAWECPICFEYSKGQEVVATQCGHVFCKKCLESHLSEFSKNCPTCRTDLSSKPSITLFNF